MKRVWSHPRPFGLPGVLLLLGAAFIFGKVQGGFVSWFLFYAFLTVVLYEIAVFLFGLYRVNVTREFSRTRLNAGEELEVRIRVRRPGRFPFAWLWVDDHVPETVKALPRAGGKLLVPWFNSEIVYTYTCGPLPRGRHRWQRVTAQAGDVYGLVRREKKLDVTGDVLVYPTVRDITAWHTLNEQHTGTDFSQNRITEEATSVIGVRDYVHGDRLSRIHWKASAKGNGLKTKEFEFETSHHLMFFLDRCTAHYGAEQHPQFERAVSLVASLSRYALNRTYATGLVSYGKEKFVMPPARYPHTLPKIYEHLAEVRADGRFPFDKVLLWETVDLPYGTTVVGVTPLLHRPLVEAVYHLRERRVKVELFWVFSPSQLSGSEQSYVRSLGLLGVSVYRIDRERFEDILREGGATGA